MEATIRAKCPHKIDIGAVYNVEVRFLPHYFVHVVSARSLFSNIAVVTVGILDVH